MVLLQNMVSPQTGETLGGRDATVAQYSVV